MRATPLQVLLVRVVLSAAAPTYTPTTYAPTEQCRDAPRWHKKNSPSKTCVWVADDPLNRCHKSGEDEVPASVACVDACGGCEPTYAPTTNAPSSSTPTGAHSLAPSAAPTRSTGGGSGGSAAALDAATIGGAAAGACAVPLLLLAALLCARRRRSAKLPYSRYANAAPPPLDPDAVAVDVFEPWSTFLASLARPESRDQSRETDQSSEELKESHTANQTRERSYFARRRERRFDWSHGVVCWNDAGDGEEEDVSMRRWVRHWRREHVELVPTSMPLPLRAPPPELRAALDSSLGASFADRLAAFRAANDAARVPFEEGRVELYVRRGHCLEDAHVRGAGIWQTSRGGGRGCDVFAERVFGRRVAAAAAAATCSRSGYLADESRRRPRLRRGYSVETGARLRYAALRDLPAPRWREMWFVAFRGEPALDAGGPSRELFRLASMALCDVSFGLFRYAKSSDGLSYEFEDDANLAYVEDAAAKLQFCGRLVGKALAEGFHWAARLNPTLLKHACTEPLMLEDLQLLDYELWKSRGPREDRERVTGVRAKITNGSRRPVPRAGIDKLLQMPPDSVGALALTFSVDVHSYGKVETTELVPGGRDLSVCGGNLDDFVAARAATRPRSAP